MQHDKPRMRQGARAAIGRARPHRPLDQAGVADHAAPRLPRQRPPVKDRDGHNDEGPVTSSRPGLQDPTEELAMPQTSGHTGTPTTPVDHPMPNPPSAASGPVPVPPPAAAETKPAERGPRWLVTVADLLERQLGQPNHVDERVKLLLAFTTPVALVVLPVLGAGVWITYLVTTHAPAVLGSIVIAGVVAGAASQITRALRKDTRNRK